MSSTTPSHRNSMSYMPHRYVPLTHNDIARIRAEVVARGPAVLWQSLAVAWDLPLDRLKTIARDIIRSA